MKFVITGGTGFLGSALLNKCIEDKHGILLLTRKPRALSDLEKIYVEVAQWDGRTLGPWVQRMEEADAIINFAGESIGGGRWTQGRKERIINSRLNATKVLIEAVGKLSKKPNVLINASGVGYYGVDVQNEVTETSPSGNDFLAQVCTRWEQEASKAEDLGLRVVRFRNGVVLEKNGGALKKMIFPYLFFIGGTLGSGQQWFPWIHREDLMQIIYYTIKNSQVRGPINVVAPEIVTMKQFCKALGKAMHRPSLMTVPDFVLRMLFGEMADMILTGQRAIPKKLQEAGFKFKYPTIESALRTIFA